jgi:OmpA-OmpF porin, OOP family
MQDSPCLKVAPLCVLLLLVLTPSVLEAQIGERMRQRARQQVERRVEARAQEAVEQGLDRTENAIRCVITDEACIEKATSEGRQVVLTDAAGKDVEGGAGSGAAAMRVGEGAWANYDFVPGDRLLFADDFSSDRVGNFPRRLEFVAGSLEIVEWQGQQFLRSTAESAFTVALPEALPERFTIEFDVHTGSFLWDVHVLTEPKRRMYDVSMARGESVIKLGRRSGLTGRDVPEALADSPELQAGLVPIRIMADGNYMKVFLNERRVANVPNAAIRRGDKVQIWIRGNEENPSFVSNIRIAAGGPSLYDALAADGRVATQGILFDTGSDRLRPESTPTLKEIGDMLRAHPQLRLRIEGHTDNVGSAATNQRLSEERAAAVRRFLQESYGIAGGRLESVGKGPSEPAAPNDTHEGRQQNRRVVLVRL